MKEQGWAVRVMELKGTRGRRKAGSAARFVRVPREWSQRRTGREEGRFCYRAGDESGELESKARKESEDCLFDSHWPAYV